MSTGIFYLGIVVGGIVAASLAYVCPAAWRALDRWAAAGIAREVADALNESEGRR